jgi:hypothetical protein
MAPSAAAPCDQAATNNAQHTAVEDTDRLNMAPPPLSVQA